jgi:glycosyltransferase involved in cell wall biosynthesis
VRILLATPIYPPDIGGPAQYVRNLSERLRQKGIESAVISYRGLRNIPQPFRLFIYFINLFNKAMSVDIIYAFNLIGCGLPALICSKLLKKKFIVRLGGDFLWEKAVESGRSKKTLKEYYSEPKTIIEKFWMNLMKTVLNSADKVIFSTNFQKQIYEIYFGIKEEQTVVVKNPFPETETIENNVKKNGYQILYAGRLIKLKNLDTLIDVFNKVVKETNLPLKLKIIGEGPEKENLEFRIKNLGLENKAVIQEPMRHEDLLKEIQKSYLCILPSLSEISPNFALECIKLTKPILMTKETGIYETFKDYILFIDPKNAKDIKEKLLFLLKIRNHNDYLNKMSYIQINYTWSENIKKHIALLEKLTKSS